MIPTYVDADDAYDARIRAGERARIRQITDRYPAPEVRYYRDDMAERRPAPDGLDDVTDEVAALRRETDEAYEALDALRAERDEYRDGFAIAGREHAKDAAELERMRAELDNIGARYSEAMRRATSAEKELAALRAELEAAGVRGGVCLECGSAVLRGEHLRDDLEPCMGKSPRQRIAALRAERDHAVNAIASGGKVNLDGASDEEE